MERVLNFGAGPSALPLAVLERMRDELVSGQRGQSVLEVSHRGALFEAILARAETGLRTALGVPASHRVLFLQGGGTGQFAAVPLNLGGRATGEPVYVETGSWSAAAAREAEKYGPVKRVSPDADLAAAVDETTPYVYVCSNETVNGIFYDPAPLAVQNVPLVADMSSELLTREIDVSQYGVIFAGAQKNAGIAGLTIVLVRDDLLGNPMSICPAVLDYTAMAAKGSMLNTPPTTAIYVTALVVEWVLENGGVKAMAAAAEKKSHILYAAIDKHPKARALIQGDRRSRVNVVWRLGEPADEKRFLELAKTAGMTGLGGHRNVGGLRASLYNAITVEDVEKLVNLIANV